MPELVSTKQNVLCCEQLSSNLRIIRFNQKEAADVLDFAKLLTEEQKSSFETLLRGVKIGYDLATGGAAKTA